MLLELINKARRRLLFNEALKQFALSAAMAIGGLALLLTVGTRYLEWWVPALFAVAVTGWAIAKLRKSWPSSYAAAVWLDDKAGLHDSLSTAHYFASSKTRPAPKSAEAEAILLAQRGQAESAAADVDVSTTVPFRFPKALYGLAALLVVSSGLVTVRYFYGHELNLSAPITEVIFQDLAAVTPPKAAKRSQAAEKREEYDEARSLLSKLGLGEDLDEKADEHLDEALMDALKSAEKSPEAGDAKPDDRLDNGDPLEGPKNPPKNNNAQPGDGKKSGEKSSSARNAGDAKSREKGEQSLLSKLKDAIDNMLGEPSPDSGKGGEKDRDQQLSKSSQGQPGQQSGESGEEESEMSSADADAGGDAQKGNSPGQTSGNNAKQQEGPSVAGTEDGVKAIKAAQQLKAMGQISELIGKRSEQVTGESMIEVQSGDQKLQTEYKDKAAAHGEGAGEVSRDEIPLSVQAYVQEYFQQVRKPDGIAGKAPAPKAQAKSAQKPPAGSTTTAPATPKP